MLPETVLVGTMEGGHAGLTGGECNHADISVDGGNELDLSMTTSTEGVDWSGVRFSAANGVVGDASPRPMNDSLNVGRTTVTVPESSFYATLHKPADRSAWLLRIQSWRC
ncbi:MAG TPA: hypothetical protein VJQ79_00010 [Acidimicrobiia bacterium]|nr:hypothetical protein [Acidimicrobiia bacterium]